MRIVICSECLYVKHLASCLATRTFKPTSVYAIDCTKGREVIEGASYSVGHSQKTSDIVSLEINFGERFCLNVYIIVIITILIAVPQGSLLELKTIAIKMSFSP